MDRLPLHRDNVATVAKTRSSGSGTLIVSDKGAVVSLDVALLSNAAMKLRLWLRTSIHRPRRHLVKKFLLRDIVKWDHLNKKRPRSTSSASIILIFCYVPIFRPDAVERLKVSFRPATIPINPPCKELAPVLGR